MADKLIKQIKVEETVYDIGGSIYNLDEGNFAKKSLVLNEGQADGVCSLAGGTTDKDLVAGIVGDSAANLLPSLAPARAKGDLAISIGAGTVSNSAGSMSIGVNSIAGTLGYYIWSISGKKIELATNRKSLTNWTRKKPSSLTWAVGDIISANNGDSTYGTSYNIKITAVDTSNMTVTVDSLPFDKINTSIVGYMPNDLFIYVPEKPSEGQIQMGFGAYAHGYDCRASGILSTAFGYSNTANGTTAFVTGRENKGGFASLVGGYQNTAQGEANLVTGKGNLVSGYASSATGQNLVVLGEGAHAEGHATTIFVPDSIDTSNVKNIFNDWNGKGATEKYSVAFGSYSHIEGQNTIATGNRAHAEGWMTAAEGWASHAEGKNTYAVGDNSHAEGQSVTSNGTAAHAEGYNTIANGEHSHAEGHTSHANGEDAHAEGKGTIANGMAAHAEGYNTSAIGEYSHSEGHNTIAYGKEAHAEGESSKKCSEELLVSDNSENIYQDWISKDASEKYSAAYGNWSHVEGQNSLALGSRSHAEGWMTVAKAGAAHAEGRGTEARAGNSHAEGLGTVANQTEQHVQGRYNLIDEGDNYAHIVGNGSSSKRANAYTLGWNGNGAYYGNLHAAKDLTVGGKATITGDLSAESMSVDNNLYAKRASIEEHLSVADSLSVLNGISAGFDYIECAYGDIIAFSASDADSPTTYLSVAGADAKEAKALAKENKARLDAQVGEGANSHVEGYSTKAKGPGSHAEGHETKANGNQAHSEGLYTEARGAQAHAEGRATMACGENAHAEGRNTTAHQIASHAEGHGAVYCPKDENNNPTKPNEPEIDSENFNLANVKAAWEARGSGEKFNMAYGNYSHTEGQGTIALGSRDHAEGWNTMAYGDATHAEGVGTVSRGAASARGQHVEGAYNLVDEAMTYMHITGIGSSNTKRDNGFTVDRSGNGWFKGNITIGGTLKDGAYSGGKTVATQEYVDNAIKGIQIPETPDLSGFATHQEVQEAVKDLATRTYVDNAISSIKIPEIPEFTWDSLPGQIPSYKIPNNLSIGDVDEFYGPNGQLEVLGKIEALSLTITNTTKTKHLVAETVSLDGGLNARGTISTNGNIVSEDLDNNIYADLQGAYNMASEAYIRISDLPSAIVAGSANGAEVFNDSRNEASGIYSHAEGEKTIATGEAAHAENYLTRAYGNFSHAEGWRVVALGDKSHAEGSSPRPFDHDEYTWQLDKGTDPRNYSSQEIFNIWNERPADARFTMSIGNWSHTEGQGCLSIGTRSHAEGWNTAACSVGSHTEGIGTISAWSTSVDPWDKAVNAQHVEGSYNIIMPEKYLHVVGNGATNDQRSNAHTLDKNGVAWYSSKILVGGYYDTEQEKYLNAKTVATEEYVDSAIAQNYQVQIITWEDTD